MLLEDERNVLAWLGEYGPLRDEQIIRLLHYKDRFVAERIVQGLKRRGYAAELLGGYIAVDPYCVPDRRNVAAIWVLTRFIHRIVPLAHYPARYPAQLIFVTADTLYEIVILESPEDNRLLRLLQPEEHTKYIIAAHNTGIIDRRCAPDAPCLYALMRYDGDGIPEIEFHKGGTENEKTF